MSDIFFEDMHVGQIITTDWSETINADIIAQYCRLTKDRNPMHIDAEYAHSFGFKNIVVPGYYLLPLSAALTHRTVKAVALIGIENARFLKPVYVGDKIRADNVISKLHDRDEKTGIAKFHRTILNHGYESCIDYWVNFLIEKRNQHEN
jgi:acyl dehydratase